MGIVINYTIKSKKNIDIVQQVNYLVKYLADKVNLIENKFKDRIIKIEQNLFTNALVIEIFIENDTILTLPFKPDKNGLICDNYLKTNFAENFIKTHVTAIEILESFKGKVFDVYIEDGGDYYKTRDVAHLQYQKEMNDIMVNNIKYAFQQVGLDTSRMEYGHIIEERDFSESKSIFSEEAKKEREQINQAIILANELNKMCGIEGSEIKIFDVTKGQGEIINNIKEFYKSKPKIDKKQGGEKEND